MGRILAIGIKNDFNFKKHPIKATLRTLFIGVFGAGMYFSVQNANVEEYNLQLTREVSILTDTNKDGATTSDEWAKVYKEFGIRYDAFSSNPDKDLTIRQKESYLDSYRGRK